MQIRFQASPGETSRMTTQQLRDNFLIGGLMLPDKIGLCYSHFDRMIIGGAVPVKEGNKPGLQYIGYQIFDLPVGVDAMN